MKYYSLTFAEIYYEEWKLDLLCSCTDDYPSTLNLQVGMQESYESEAKPQEDQEASSHLKRFYVLSYVVNCPVFTFPEICQ